jgi:hypothetical protein
MQNILAVMLQPSINQTLPPLSADNASIWHHNPHRSLPQNATSWGRWRQVNTQIERLSLILNRRKTESIYRKIDNAVFWNAAKVSGCVRAHHNFMDASTIFAFFETTLVLLVMRPR